MPANIVAFVGQNENGILRHLSQGLMQLLEPLGYRGHLIDLGDPGWPGRLQPLLTDGIAMAWGHAGIGAKLELDGQCLWDRVAVPFVSVLADPPCWMPQHHSTESDYVVNAYLYPEWLRIQRRFIRARQHSALVEGGLVPNPLRDATPWSRRPNRMVLVKTGADAGIRRLGWQSLPRRWRAALEDAAAIAIRRPTGDITEIVLAAAESQNLVPEHRTDLLFALMTEVDLFVRDTRSTALAEALLHLPVDIYGRGWDHLACRATRARFHPAINADTLPHLYAETQYMLNTTPNFSSGIHERIAYGLDARCCVVSDQNDFMRTALADLPTLLAIDPHDPGLPDRMQAILDDPTDHGDATQVALDRVTELFDGRRYMLSLLDLAEEARMSPKLSGYRH